MRKYSVYFPPIILVVSILLFSKISSGQTPPAQQTLRIKDFAIWGGSAASQVYNTTQGVFMGSNATIKGNVGSNHRIDAKNNFTVTGDIYSGNTVILNNNSTITGNVIAAKKASNFSGNAISSGNNGVFSGNLTANGKIIIPNTKVTGMVAVPAPTTSNYSGPTPTGGITNLFTLPVNPLMPFSTPFDNQLSATDITNTQTIKPGIYRRLALSGNKTLTFDGPGNYIFYEVNNGNNTNKIVYDFKGTSTGTINILIITNANWGRLTVSTVNGNFPSRIYTEVHGNGVSNGGMAFRLNSTGALPNGSYTWLGLTWVPKGGIQIDNITVSNKPNIIGALWSGTVVNISNNLNLEYTAPATEPNFITPYYTPPTGGKVQVNNNKIGAELYSLITTPATPEPAKENDIFRFEGTNRVFVEVVSKEPNDITLKDQLMALGMNNMVDNGPHSYIITGSFLISNISQLNNNSRIEYVRPLYPPISNRGQVTSQGDETMRSDNVRDRFGLDGSGVKVGVISDSYNSRGTANIDIQQGDLPADIQIVADLPIPGNDEGRAMLQIVHDIATNAKLAFYTGFLSAGNFAKGIQTLADPNLEGGRCDVIVDDITYITEPFLRDGIVAKTVDEVVGQGVTYFSSAGNFANRSHEAVFNSVSNPSLIPAPGTIHRFGTTSSEIYQSVNLKPGSYTIVLQWGDDFHSLGSTVGVQSDLDLYIVDANGFRLFGFNRSNLFGDPYEVCPFTVTEETSAKIMVVNASGNSSVRFKYIIFRGEATIANYQTGASTIVGHPNAKGAIAVGAMLYDNIPPFTPVWPGVASFSSIGGTNTVENNTYVVRNKPELVGPNGVNTTVSLGGPVFDDGDPYPNFFGTSAAAPHVAAVAALLIQGQKKYNQKIQVLPGEIRQQLQSSAGKFTGTPGTFSFTGGYGFVQADSAAQQIANARPILTALEAVTPGAQNGNSTFMVRLKGKYLTSSTQIFVNDIAMATTVSADKTEATAMVNDIPAGQDPSFRLFNAAKSLSGLDGGYSEPLYFFNSTIKVTVRTRNVSRKFGQNNPSFTADVLVNGVPINQTNLSLAALKLDGQNLVYTTIANASSRPYLYSVTPGRATPLATNDPLLSTYSFTFSAGTLEVAKMPLKITPDNKRVKYGEFPEVTFQYELEQSANNASTLLEEVQMLHKKYLADNGLVVLSGNSGSAGITPADFTNMSMMASFQSLRNARKLVLENGQLKALVNNIDPSLIGSQRFFVDVSVGSIQNYKTDPDKAMMIQPASNIHARGVLNLKALVNGSASAAVPGGQLQPIINGQLLAMVNGQLQALVNGQLKALVNGIELTVEDFVFQNGQLLALVIAEWIAVTNGQLKALVNGETIEINLSVTNGQLKALVNGEEMQLQNGQLQAVVNGQLLALVNGQLKAMVNSQLMPIVNGQLMAMVNGQLKALVNGQLLAMINGQLLALVNGELEIVEDLALINGQLRALVNGQLKAIVNGQLKAMVNGSLSDLPITAISLVNGQLRALVNGQLQALVNGQLRAIVNGQLQPLVNGGGIVIESVHQLANGQLRALVNGINIPISNGQLQGMVNGQLLAMANGQLMAVVNGSLTFAVLQNGQLKALVNGELQPLANGQLLALVNGQLKALVNAGTSDAQPQPDNSYRIINGQLKAMVNGQLMPLVNGQLLALPNGQLQAMVNNFDITGSNNNAKTLVLVDQDDISLQNGGIGGMFAINMITGLNVGMQTLIPGAFVNEGFEVTYGLGEVEIVPALLVAKASDVNVIYGDPVPEYTMSIEGFAYDENTSHIIPPAIDVTATPLSNVGTYPIFITGGSSANYSFFNQPGILSVQKKELKVIADNKVKVAGVDNPPLTIRYEGLVGNDTEDDVCLPFVTPPTPKVLDQLERRTTYSNVKINGTSNVYHANPGENLSLTGSWNLVFIDPANAYCPGCITQLYIGMINENGIAAFTDCYDVSGTGSFSGVINKTFTAPSAPGVYYITQVSSWEYNCYDRGAGHPGNDPNNAIAVVVVNMSNNKITATTTADINSTLGVYPITLLACSNYNPNYDVILQNGILTVQGEVNSTAKKGMATSVQTKKEEGLVDKTTADALYPNPATTVIRLMLSEELVSVNGLATYDPLGKVVKVPIKKISNSSYELNIAHLPKGVYIIKAVSINGIKIFKFIKE